PIVCENMGTVRRNDMRIRKSLAVALFLFAGCGGAFAADPSGTWMTQAGTSRIKIADCGGALCGTIIWLKEPNDPDTGKPTTDKNNSDSTKRSRPLMGVQIVLGMKPNGADKWAGQVYKAEDGKTYTGNIEFSGGNYLT